MLAHAGGADETLSIVLLFGGLWIGWVGWSRLKGRGFPRLPTGGAWGLLAIGVLLAVSAAVVPRMVFGPTGVPAAASPAASRPASIATIQITTPTDGASAQGASIDVVMRLRGGTIVDAANTALTADTGHVHLSLDGKLVSMTYGLVQEVSIADLEPGTHALEAEFVAADHAPFEPRVTSTVTFDVPS